MKVKTVDVIFLQTNFRHGLVDAVLGHAFYFFSDNKSFRMSITPYSDPTLVPISDIVLEVDSMRFNAVIDAKVQGKLVDYDGVPESPIIGELIKKTNEGAGITLGFNSNNDIQYQSEDGELTLRLSNRKNEVIYFFHPQRRMIYLENENATPAQPVNFLQGTVLLVDENLKFFGKNEADGSGFELTWKLDFSPEILKYVIALLQHLVKVSAKLKV